MSVTSDFYLARADECARDANVAQLPNVRERCLRSESAWRAMADKSLRTELDRAKAAAEKAAQADETSKVDAE